MAWEYRTFARIFVCRKCGHVLKGSQNCKMGGKWCLMKGCGGRYRLAMKHFLHLRSVA